jgi:hypothetical protein
MRETNIEWTCENQECLKQFRLFSDDNGGDFTICWNYCPHCGARNDIWIRFLNENQLKEVPLGVSPEEGKKLAERKAYKLLGILSKCETNTTVSCRNRRW